MPYVSDGVDWGLTAADLKNTVKASTIFKPVGGVLPAGVLTVSAFNATAQTYTNPALYLWNDPKAFNTQGQHWEIANSIPANGCKNVATERTSGGSSINHIIEFETLLTGQDFDITVVGSSSYECMVYVEQNGTMFRAEATPRVGTTTGVMHLPLSFDDSFHGRVRVVLAGALFVGIKCEQSSIVKKSEDRPFAVCDGSDWSEGIGIKQASGVSWLCLGLSQYLFEKTGIVIPQRGMPDTGYFRNGTATVTADTANASNASRYFSQDRKDMVQDDFGGKPVFYLITGSRADGGNSGATGSPTGAMANRAKACYEWLRSKDKFATIVQLSTTPFTGAGAAGTVTGPPTAGNGHDLNHQEQVHALSGIKRAAFVNLFGPASPPFTGTGSNGSPSTSQQAQLIGADGVNPNDVLFELWADLIARAIGNLDIHALRSRRLV